MIKFNQIQDKKVKKYVESVLNGEITAGKWVKLACKRFVDDFDNLELEFDEKAANHVIEFFEKYLRHSKGEWAGQPIILEGWERFILSNIFGWKSKKTGLRRFRTAYIETGRKNGKTLLISGIGNYLFIADGEPGAEVYSAAVKRDQARLSHSEAKRMIKSSPILNSRVKVFKDNLNIEQTASKFEPLGADADSLDGLNIHGALIDELHAHKTRDMWDVLETATGARRQPIQIAITTAGFDRETICWQIHDYIQKILEKVIEDDTFFGIIYAIDEEDRIQWENEIIWQKANPNLNISVKLEDLQRKAKRAKEIPSQLNAFLQKHLDVWTEAAEIWIPLEKWDRCFMSLNENDLQGKTCHAGLDLSSRLDITALTYTFSPEFQSDKYKVIYRYFIPEDNMRERVRRDRVPYDAWYRQGFLYATSGNVIDYSFILQKIIEDCAIFNVMSLTFDPYGATRFIQDLQGLGFEEPKANKLNERLLIEFRHTYTNFTNPVKEMEKLITGEEILFQKNPVMRWMASNVVIRQGAAGGLMPDKAKSRERIDGIVSALMGLSRATLQCEQPEPMISVL